MIKLKDLLEKKIIFYKPNFENEWEEAMRYPDLFPDKQTWFDKTNSGKMMTVNCQMNIDNTDMCEPNVQLEPKKIKRVAGIVKSGKIELPIVMKYKNKYELIGGNTRLVALKTAGLPTKAWVFVYN
tara:strand:+ start:58 stop:435 length:378 start_codon:yes stop_codon:yes gene_type:complete